MWSLYSHRGADLAIDTCLLPLASSCCIRLPAGFSELYFKASLLKNFHSLLVSPTLPPKYSQTTVHKPLEQIIPTLEAIILSTSQLCECNDHCDCSLKFSRASYTTIFRYVNIHYTFLQLVEMSHSFFKTKPILTARAVTNTFVFSKQRQLHFYCT